jgi:hypothetical protein
VSANTPSPIEGGASTSLKGWNALAYTVASDVPTALRRAASIRRAALRQLAHVGPRK